MYIILIYLYIILIYSDLSVSIIFVLVSFLFLLYLLNVSVPKMSFQAHKKIQAKSLS